MGFPVTKVIYSTVAVTVGFLAAPIVGIGVEREFKAGVSPVVAQPINRTHKTITKNVVACFAYHAMRST